MSSIKGPVINWLYTHVLKHVFFLIDPEKMHDGMVGFGQMLGKFSTMRAITRGLFNYQNPMLEQTLLGINFKNPIGLAAGFDKDAKLTQILPSVGFAFEEIGSITGEASEGNPKPRLWRLPQSRSLIVYYGLKNDGADAISARLKNIKFAFPIGVSVAKTNCEGTVEVQAGIDDYLKAYKAFSEIGDYYTINISCPNAFGGQPFSDPARLELLLKEIYALPKTKPIFLKMPPDIATSIVDEIIALAEKYDVDGFICTNLTKDRDLPDMKTKIIDELPTDKGGLSGKVVQSLSDKMIEYIYKKTSKNTDKKFIIIGCGGVFNVEDAYRKIKLGASLIQMITGMIYEGPQMIGEINRGLVRLLQRDGYKNIGEAVGVDNR